MAQRSPAQENRGGVGGQGSWLLQASLIILAGFWVFAPALHGEWVWDDALYVPNNALLHDPHRLWKIWFSLGSTIDYYPITSTVQYAQWHFWHNNTFDYHLTNVVLHLISSLLVWRLLGKFRLRYAWIGGLIFAVHPMMVESVTLISELKNTLSLPPFLVAMCAYVDYEEHHRTRDYLLALGFFLVAMLCKISMLPFPAVILLYVWWKRGRIGWDSVRAAIPFFAVSIVLGLMTILTGTWFRESLLQPTEAVQIGGTFSKLALAGLTLTFYFAKSIWPTGPSLLYPKWPIDPPSLLQFYPWLILAGALYLLWIYRATWGRHGLLGLGFFLIMLSPFLGFPTVNYMIFTWVFDHFLYIPILGLIGLAVALGETLQAKLPSLLRVGSVGIVALLLTLMAWESHSYAGVFSDEITLWTHTLEINPTAWIAHNNLGNALARAGRYSDAIAQFREAVRLKPNLAEAWNNWGSALLEMGEPEKAVTCFENALKIKPNFAEAQDNWGRALVVENQDVKAIDHFREALRISSNDAVAHKALANALFQTGHVEDAGREYKEAIIFDPSDAETHYLLANILAQEGHVPVAIRQFEAALKIDPNLAEAHFNLGNALIQSDQTSDAAAQYAEAVQINPDYEDAHANLGNALLQLGRTPEAIEQYEQALRINPGDIDVRNNLGVVLLHLGRIAEAKEQFAKALSLAPDNKTAQKGLAQVEATEKGITPQH